MTRVAGMMDWFVPGECGCKIVRELKVRLAGEETDNVENACGCVCAVGGECLLGG